VLARSTLLFATLASTSACALGETAAPTGVVPSYLAIVVALADDDIASVRADADELGRIAATMSASPGMAKVASGAKALGGADIEATRTAFKSVSDGMIEYMRADASTQAGNTIVFCPMAFADTGALWVQAHGKIANPYFGASMMRCGNKLAWDAALPATAAL